MLKTTHTIAAAAVLAIALAACTAQQQSDATQCAAGLMAARATTAAELLMAVQQIPPCRALAIDAMQVVVAEVMARRGIR